MAAGKVISLEQLDQNLELLGEGINYGPAMKSIRQSIIASTKENFQEVHDPDGNAWPHLVRARPGSKGSDRPLQDKGLLRESVTAAGHPGNIDTLTDTRVEWGTNLEYAAVHQFGAIIRPKNARALAIPLTKEAKRAGSPRNFPRPLRLVKRKGKPPLLVELKKVRGKADRGARSEAHYILLPSVTIPARPFLGLGDKDQKRIDEILDDHTRRQVDQRLKRLGL